MERQMATLKGVMKRGNYWTWYWRHKIYTGGKQIERSNHYRTEREAAEARQAFIRTYTGSKRVPPTRSYNYQNHGHIYILQYDQYYKIGHTINQDPFRRINGIMGALPQRPTLMHIANVINVMQIERQLHRQYHHCRTNGEWFLLQKEDLKDIKRELLKHKYISPMASRYRYTARNSIHRDHIVQSVPDNPAKTQFYCETCQVYFQGREHCVRKIAS